MGSENCKEVVTLEGKEVHNEDDKEMGICKTKKWATRRVWVGGGATTRIKVWAAKTEGGR